jgi:membrane protein
LFGINVAQLAKRLWTDINEDQVFGRAAQLSYYFLLALFPLLLFLVNLLGYLAHSGSQLRDSLMSYLATVMPASSVQLVQTTLDEISNSRGGGKLSFGLLAALWAASNGMGAITETLNVAYDVKETRPWWKVRLVSIFLTLAVSILIVIALVIVLYGGRLADFLSYQFGFGDVFRISWKILQWPIALLFVLITFHLIYYFAPNVRHRRWSTPGAVVAVALWLLISFGFKLYLNFFNSYSVTYGSLGALIIMMLWFYLTGASILIGGELNSELERLDQQRMSEQ